MLNRKVDLQTIKEREREREREGEERKDRSVSREGRDGGRREKGEEQDISFSVVNLPIPKRSDE